MKQLVALLFFLAISSTSIAQVAPEASSTIAIKKVASGHQFMATTANHHATKAAYRILEQGGSAVDAAIAAELVLAVVEPQSSGLGGGGFMLVYDAKTKEITSFDGRETAPSTADESLFYTDGVKTPFFEAIASGASVGVPAIPKLLEVAHQEFGHLNWHALFDDAIRLADEGFALSERMHKVASATRHLNKDNSLGRLLYNEQGTLYPTGTTIRQPKLGGTLSILAGNGTAPFYQGRIAHDIVNTVRQAGGLLSLKDLHDYQIKKRTTLCKNTFGYKFCGMPAPSSGPITVIMALSMLEELKLQESTPYSANYMHHIFETLKFSFADRNRYIGDPDFSTVPVEHLLDNNYLTGRAELIGKDAIVKATPGNITTHNKLAPSIHSEPPSTTHISIVDRYGNAVAFTSSIEHAFGSGLHTESGIILNNQLTDFDFIPTDANQKPTINRVQANKRPRSSMSPMIVLNDDGSLRLVIGSTGGSRIIAYVLKALVNHLVFDMPLGDAIDSPNIAHTNRQKAELETQLPQETLDNLKERGHQLTIRNLVSGTHAIALKDGRLIGAADSRREGQALGQ